MTRTLFTLTLGLVVWTAPALAVLPGEMLPNPALEARARSISADLRCVVCQNQSIDDSDAPLAHDLRVIVRERLVAGDSDAAVKQYLVDRYGHFVLLKPPVEPATWLLWLAPLLVIVPGGVLIARLLRGSRGTPAPLTHEEDAAWRRLMGGNPE